MKKALVDSYWSVGELTSAVAWYGDNGYRIITVFQTNNEMFHIVVQEF